ncbi:MAG: S8 family serine peptidase [Saprospiraceae bacterium]|nr:S8 family serine peptidase [Saprospiraceae bacterium]
MRSILVILLLCYNLIVGAQYSNSYVAHEWVVQFDRSINFSKQSTALDIERISANQNIYLVTFDTAVDEKQLVSSIAYLPKALYVFPNLDVEKRSIIPNDPLYNEQWNLEMISLPQLWEETQGGVTPSGEEIVIAVLDDGIDINHEDLRNNIWINKEEIPDDNLDNDGNGYIDDYFGVNIQEGRDEHPILDHGTNVAGIIGAEGDNELGITGINWNCKIMVLSGVTNVAEIIAGFDYVYNMKQKYLDSNGAEGANVVVTNFSAGIRRVFPVDFPGWCSMYNLLGSVGILSVGATANEDFNIDIEGDMPSLCSSEFLIVATNSNINDELVRDVATSAIHVDMASPGDRIRSLDINNEYGIISGTSASTPHIAGAVALMYSVECEAILDQIANNPAAAALTIKEALMSGVDKSTTYFNTVSGGRLNVYNALLELQPICGLANVGALEVRSVESKNNSGTSLDLVVEYVTDKLSDHEIFISNALGQLIYKQAFNPSVFEERVVRLDNLSLPTGIYFISISNGERVASKSHFVISI